jgi:hypothetical protein
MLREWRVWRKKQPMRTFKTFLVVSTVVALAAAPRLRAEDTPEQAQLRELLRKSMTQKEGQPSVAPKVTPTPAPKPAPAAKPAPAPKPAPAMKPAPEIKPVAVEQPKIKPAPAAPAPAEFSAVPPANADQPALREALRIAAAEPLATIVGPPVQKKPAPAKVEAPKTASTTDAKPMEPKKEAKPKKVKPTTEPKKDIATIPPSDLPISATKEERLAELLRQYKADTITPEQYHKQRAAILAEP